jgi:hypothetical protein
LAAFVMLSPDKTEISELAAWALAVNALLLMIA